MTLDLEKSWSWGSNRQLHDGLLNQSQLIPKPVKVSKNLGTFLRYIDENQVDDLFQDRCASAYQRLRRLSSVRFPLADKLKLVWLLSYQSGDILVKPTLSNGLNFRRCRELSAIQFGILHNKVLPRCFSLNWRTMRPTVVGPQTIISCLRNAYYLHPDHGV